MTGTTSIWDVYVCAVYFNIYAFYLSTLVIQYPVLGKKKTEMNSVCVITEMCICT